jgi:hypothetical protein
MKDFAEQQVCAKFCLKLAKTSDVEASLSIGLFKPNTMLQMAPTFQIGQNIHQRQSQN